MLPPDRITTGRLVLRRWRRDDAALLKAALDASVDQLRPWIPWAVAEPAPLPELEARLDRFSAEFDQAREWLYAILPPDESEVLGGVGLYPRAASGRVPFAAADHVEIGYWLRTDATGHGYATEAARAMLDVAAALPGAHHVEIRCDPRNAASAAIPRRLGFRHARTIDEPGGELMVWEWERASAERRVTSDG